MKFSASRAEQLMQCPGSANLELAIPGFVMPDVDPMKGMKGEGTKMHNIMESFGTATPEQLHVYQTLLRSLADLHYKKRWEVIEATMATLAWLGKQPIYIKGVCPVEDVEDWVVLLERLPPRRLLFMAECADYVERLLEGRPRDTVVRTEEGLIANWLPSKPQTTPDITIVGQAHLEVVDYKAGAVPIDPVLNPQGMFYAACKRHLAPDATEFTVHILQPGNLTAWTAPIETLDAWMNDAINADRRILAKDLTLSPGDGCKFCPANPHSRGDKGRPLCPVQMELLYPQNLTSEDVDEILSM